MRRYVSAGKYYWKTPGEGAWLPSEWAYTPNEIDVASTLTTTERMSRWLMKTLLRADAVAERVDRERLAMTAVRRHEQAYALGLAGNRTRTAAVVAVRDCGVSVDAHSSPSAQAIADASVVTVEIEIDGCRWDAVTLLPRTAVVVPAQEVHVFRHPDDPIPLWAGR
ncbi:hypothetical protein M1247_08540 [Mycobacterium sp. 21AC1]|uniref:hypothetical protein n=1 Tax=[Mycobacterium] appelbergii TaxID=2939269 RepID=UPI0029393B64|nr:hypothetical protein [Mycobacterium sp. 21AC1]MDV3124957.1 hypothetical protein [Mycobacterium sp. 21AC1]